MNDPALEKIFSNWRDFCVNMGNTAVSTGFAELFMNRKTSLACDFANCAILAYRSHVELENDIRKIGILFSPIDCVIYAVRFAESLSSPQMSRKCSIMVFAGHPPTFDIEEFKIVELSLNDVSMFADTVFRAFGYDKRFRKDSECLYRLGMSTGKIRTYGVKMQNALVACALTHHNHDGMGIELVSTLPEFRRRGIATSLIRHLVREAIQNGETFIWLFSNTGSYAERLYCKLGFQTKYQMDVIQVHPMKDSGCVF